LSVIVDAIHPQFLKILSLQKNRVMGVDKESLFSELFNSWNAALQTGEPDKVIKLYASNAILISTLSNFIRHNHDEIQDYFAHFLVSRPNGVIDEANIRIFNDILICSGIYTFNFALGPVQTVKARFTFVYQRLMDNWLIVEHHSSAMPQQ